MSTFSSMFGGSSKNEQPAVLTPQQQIEEFKKQYQTELATVNATELVNKVTDAAFEKCPTGDPTCIKNCVQKYMVSWNIISQTYAGLVQNAAKH